MLLSGLAGFIEALDESIKHVIKFRSVLDRIEKLLTLVSKLCLHDNKFRLTVISVVRLVIVHYDIFMLFHEEVIDYREVIILTVRSIADNDQVVIRILILRYDSLLRLKQTS